MALNQHLALLSHPKLLPFHMKPSFPTKLSYLPAPIQCMSTPSVRRSANFQPSIWHYNYIQSLKSEFLEESYKSQSNRLKEEVRVMLCQVANPLDQLEFIDVLQRLGVAYHFNVEIRSILESLYNTKDANRSKNLHVTALEFRIFRQHGYDMSTVVFDEFQDGMGNFKTCFSHDIRGILSLYEASFLSFEDETIMDKARDFTSKYLNEYEKKEEDNYLSLLVSHALEIPLHWRMSRLEARWFIDAYQFKHDKCETLLKLAKLDFNMVQVPHQEDLKHTSRWWQRLGLGKLSFARDRLMENFFWTVGEASHPHFGNFRREMTKVNALITTIDDIYEVYGTLEELELFTNTVDRWDINAMDGLPDYMKICFLALYNNVNEMAFNILKEKGYHAIPQLKKGWADICKAYMKEAKWYMNGYKPSLQEYMENAWISIGGPTVLFHAYFWTPNSTTKEDLEHLEEFTPVIHYSSVIFRLANDLGTSKREMEMGDVPKSIECYINENGTSEEIARDHIKSMISKTWKKMNKEKLKYSFSKSFMEIAMNLPRMALCMYEHGDGHTCQDLQIKNHILSLLIQSISIE